MKFGEKLFQTKLLSRLSHKACRLLSFPVLLRNFTNNNLSLSRTGTSPYLRSIMRVTNRFFGIRDFPYLKLGIRDLKAKSGRDSGLKVYARGGMPKITLGITRLHEVLGHDYGIEEPYWGPQ